VEKEPAAVLLVEDHDSVRIAIARFLKAGGFNVLDAATPDEAKSIWKKHATGIALLLVDIDLITMTGPDLVQELLKDGPPVPVIFTTAADDSQSLKAAGSFPNPTILHKPFTAEVLVKAVRNELSAPSALAGFTTFFKRPSKSAAKPAQA